jgi:iron complex outermembrane receptor protein
MKLYLPFFYVALLSLGIMPPAVAKALSYSAHASPNQASAAPAPDGEMERRSLYPASSKVSQSPIANRQSPITEIPRLSEIELPLTSVEGIFQESLPRTADLSEIAQVEAEVVQVTGVRLNSTGVALEVILETVDGRSLPVETRSQGNTLIADIPNAVLALGSGNEFRADNPAKGIISVSVTQLNASSVRVTVTGETGVPTSQVASSPSGLVLSLTPAAQKPDEPTQEPAMEAEEEIEIVVTGEQEENYRVPNATTATRTDTPIRDVPQSIQVVPQQVLEDRQVTELNDALRNVSGISIGDSPLRPFDSPIIRGFSESFSSNVFVNGIRRVGGGPVETTNVERIEVLKGPASVLYGQGEPGGLINLVTKQPLSEPYYTIEGTIGNFDFYRSAIDISGPLNADKTALYRLNAAYLNSGTFVDFVDIERFFIAPVFSFQLGENTNLILEGSYYNDSRPEYTALPAVGTVLPNPLGHVPISRYLGDPDFSTVNYIVSNVGYRLEHKFSDNWSIRNAFRAEFSSIGEREQLFPGRLQADNRTVPRFASRSTGGSQNYTIQTDIIGKIQTGTIKQDLLLGLELRRFTDDFQTFDADAPSIDLFEPVYGLPPLQFEKTYDAFQSRNSVGVYAQDLISIGDQLKILLGGRFDLVEQKYDGRLTGESTLVQQDTAFSPRIGIVYQPTPPVSLYTSFSRSFAPEGGFGSRNADGTPFEPTTGQQFEVGVKTEFLDGRLSATLAAYQITKQNIVTEDPNRPNFSIQIGERRSKGIELDVVGEILPGFNIIASYAYTDAEITQDNSGFEGNQPNNVPQHSGSLWATYEIQSGGLQGLGFGAGIFVVGNRKGDLANTFDLPSYTRTDAAIYYRRDNWQVGLNVRNLFDVEYFESASNRNRVNPGAPLTILGTFSVKF